MIGILSLNVILFNDPLFAITVLKPNLGTTIIGVFFISIFIVSMIKFWLIMLS